MTGGGRGFRGRAPPAKMWGHARGWRPFISDYNHLLDTFEDQLPRPWIAMGHSMGGGLTTLALAEGEARFAGVVLSSPMMCVATGERSLTSVKHLSIVMTSPEGRGSCCCRRLIPTTRPSRTTS